MVPTLAGPLARTPQSLLPQSFPLRWRLTIAMIVAALAAGLLSVVNPTPAAALCVTQPMQGDWRNIDPDTRSITRTIVGFNCGDVRLCDQNGNCSGGESSYTVRPFGACSPTACDWGTRRTYAMADGWQRATYTHSWSTKYVWIKPYSFYGRQYLRVYVWTDFTAADGRTDYASDVWMLK